MSLRKFTDWLYLPDGLVPIISRLVGLISLPIGFIVWFFTHSGCGSGPYPGPFNVPAWRFGSHLLALPLPPEPVNAVIFLLFALAAILLVLGKGYRPLYIYMATVVAYYSSRDFFVCMLHWVLLDFLFLVALSFRAKNKNERSPSRRLIQLTLCFCYLFGVLQKLFYPDFWQGISLEATFYDGYGVSAPFKDFFLKFPLPMSFWCASSIFLMLSETFLGLGLFFKRTRILACILGFILHGGILVTMDPVLAIFSIEMWTGYLAFFEGTYKNIQNQNQTQQQNQAAEPGPVSRIKTALSLAFIALMILMPLRIYYLPGPPNDLLTLFERTPWGFGMFLMRQKVEQLDIAFDDTQGNTHTVPVFGRMHTASNDNELLSIAAYVLKNNPGAKSIRINDLIVVNERRNILRTLIWDNPSAPESLPKISVTSAGDYCRGAANRSLESDHHP
jgi:hypothetical protein